MWTLHIWHFSASWKVDCTDFLFTPFWLACVFFQPPPLVARLRPGAAQPSALQLLRPCLTLHDPLQPADHRQHHAQATPQIAPTKTTYTYVHRSKSLIQTLKSAHTCTEKCTDLQTQCKHFWSHHMFFRTARWMTLIYIVTKK